MRRRTTALALLLSLVLLSGGALLLVDFRLKENSRGLLRAAPPAPPQPNANEPSTSTPSPSSSSPPPTGEAPEAPPSPRPQVDVDGRIAPDEYAHAYYAAEIDLWLYWTVDEAKGLIYLGLKSPAPGWVAISFAPTGPRMKGGDILIGYVDEGGAVRVRDDYAHEVVSHAADAELGEGADDIRAAAGRRTPEGGTVLELVRPLTAADPYDKPIQPGLMRVQLAYSEVADFESYHTARAQLEVDFFTGEVKPVPLPSTAPPP